MCQEVSNVGENACRGAELRMSVRSCQMADRHVRDGNEKRVGGGKEWHADRDELT